MYDAMAKMIFFIIGKPIRCVSDPTIFARVDRKYRSATAPHASCFIQQDRTISLLLFWKIIVEHFEF